MAVFRVEKDQNFTVMSNFHLRDMNLSNKSIGLLSKMLSLPPEWDFTSRGLASICRDGIDSINSSLKELEEVGYLRRRRLRDAQGKMRDVEYTIYERPQPALPNTENPILDNPILDEPITENPAQLNKDRTNQRPKENKELLNIDSIPSGESRPSVLADLDRKRKEATCRDIEIYREIVKENIEYDALCHDMPLSHDRIDEILELIVETVCTPKQYIRVAGADYPAEVVRSRFLKLDSEHIRYVFDCLNENTTKVRNIKQYMLTTLFNAPTTIGSYFSALVQHDMYGDRSRD